MAAEPALAGRTALITGASRGIGAECARLLNAEGARLALIARDLDRMVAEVAKPLAATGLAVHAFRCDLTDRAALERTLPKVRAAIGVPDIVVNNAAAFVLKPAHDTLLDEFERVLALNVTAAFAFVHEFLPAMRARGSGHIVNIGSIADHRAFPNNAAYGASKYALRGLHEALRAELRGSGIRLTLVSPGHVDTGIWDDVDVSMLDRVGPRAGMLAATAVADAVRWAVTRPSDVDVEEIRIARA